MAGCSSSADRRRQGHRGDDRKGRRLSGVTQKLASDADQLNDQLAELKAASSGASTKLAGEMLPALVDITKAISIAYTEGGKLQALLASMGAIGAFLFTDEFASATTKIRDLEFELGVLEARRQSASTGIIDALLFWQRQRFDWEN